MNRNQEFENMRNEYQKTELPQNGREQMKMMIEKAKFDRARYDKSRIKKQMFKLSFGMVATAACAILILPNTSAGIAMAMEKLPVIGPIVRVVTIREYKFDDGHNNANVEVTITYADNSRTSITVPVKHVIPNIRGIELFTVQGQPFHQYLLYFEEHILYQKLILFHHFYHFEY